MHERRANCAKVRPDNRPEDMHLIRGRPRVMPPDGTQSWHWILPLVPVNDARMGATTEAVKSLHGWLNVSKRELGHDAFLEDPLFRSK